MLISDKTLQDLEFQTILEQILGFAFLDSTKAKIQELKPISNFQELYFQLNTTNEYLGSFQSDNLIPYSAHFQLAEFLNRLEIENYHLQIEDFLQIKSNCIQIKELKKHFEKREEYFPYLSKKIAEICYEKEIVKQIDLVFNRHGEIKNDASKKLETVRKEITKTVASLSKRFNESLSRNSAHLDEIRESVVDNVRVLAVKSAVRKRVKGRFLGTSKTGSISFIQPESVILLQRDLEEYKEEEAKEILAILIQLTTEISFYKDTLLKYEDLLNFLDLTQAKAQYALEVNACLPNLHNQRILELKDSFHPILWKKNREINKKTIPQDLVLNTNQRIIIISGPNAGGKSITLKTVGLLQVMIQSGILVTVNPKSQMGIFEQILTDIGDNQSIENQLSTYSYRLKQMSKFLQIAKENSLILIDEFGTGSDPDLGGALAEVFFEEFYELKCFGIFTTHYTNIKLKSQELEATTNACMLFDERSLVPLYKLEVGQAGSSFTFEVAQKNRIPYRLINRAKKKVEREKVSLDKTILKLQQEKFNIQKTKNEINSLKVNSQEKQRTLEKTEDKIQQKLVQFQDLYEREQKILSFGKKTQEFLNRYQQNHNKKQLIASFLKFIEIEKSKTNNHKLDKRGLEKIVEKKLRKELKNNHTEIQNTQKILKEKREREEKKKIENLKVGDRVKIKDSNSIGTIEKIENETISINYGTFRTKISIFAVLKV